MKTNNRFSVILLSFVMAVGMILGMSLAAKAENYNLWVGKTQVTTVNMNDVFNDGKVSYTPAQGTTAAKLKLSGYIYEGEGYDDLLDTGTNGVIWTGENLIIELSGSNSIKNTETASEAYAIYSKGNLSITGAAEAVLNAEGNYCGIYAGSGLTVDGGDITATGESSHGIRGDGPIQINNGKVDATSNGSMASGLSSNDVITINGGSVTANGDNELTNGIGADDVYINGGNVVASGKVCGINVVYKVVNKIPGIGWTNKEGTAGKTDIPVSTQGQNLSSYKKVHFQAVHIHSFTYAASGATITATCTADGCTLHPSTEGGSDHVAKLTIVKPTLTTYGQTGKSAAATLTGLEDFNTATGKSLAVTNIKYVGRDGTEYTESTTAPTNAGKYTAKITLSSVKTGAGDNQSVTAFVDYEIAGVATTINPVDSSPAVPNKALSFTGQPQPLVTAGTVSGGTLEYALGTDANTAPADGWSTAIPTATEAGTYYVWYRIIGDANHNDVAPACIVVTIEGSASDYTLLASMKTSGNKAFKLKWTAVSGAEGYDVFFGRVGKKAELKTSVNGTSCKIGKLKKGKAYRAFVKAWKTENGQKVYIGQASPDVYAITGGRNNRYTNPKKITVKKKKLTVAVGGSKKIKASLKKFSNSRRYLKRTAKIRYFSSDHTVATVNAKGKVTGVAPGTCTVYAVAENGLRKGVKITVK